jgi:ferredoxin--NADP+ reductase
MSRPGSEALPLRVAVIGSGPAGFYTVQALLKPGGPKVAVDMFDALATPFGLVRYGVAPDHQKIKSVTAVYNKLAGHPDFRFFGNVKFGRDISLRELREHYHQIVFCTGAQTDRQLGIPGEELRGSRPATEFVAWYNGHPDYCDLEFDLDCEAAVVVGVGNVAVDVARILCRTQEELAATDIADHALRALERSRIRRVYLLGRRGPAQAAFTNPEVKELGEMVAAQTSTRAEEMEIDPLSQPALEGKAVARKVEILRELIGRSEPDKPRRLDIRFLVSPVEILGDEGGRVSGVRIARNELVEGEGGRVRCRTGDVIETLPAGVVFRSVGYRGVALPELPFREDWGTIPNDAGRITDSPGGSRLNGLYVSGWIKRGPSGVIGTNKPDAVETVASMLEDIAADRSLAPGRPAPDRIEQLLRGKDLRFVTYGDWLKIDEIELARGRREGRPRVKFATHRELLEAAGGS